MHLYLWSILAPKHGLYSSKGTGHYYWSTIFQGHTDLVMEKIKLPLCTLRVNVIYAFFLVAMIDSLRATQLLAQWERADYFCGYLFFTISDTHIRKTQRTPATPPLSRHNVTKGGTLIGHKSTECTTKKKHNLGGVERSDVSMLHSSTP